MEQRFGQGKIVKQSPVLPTRRHLPGRLPGRLPERLPVQSDSIQIQKYRASYPTAPNGPKNPGAYSPGSAVVQPWNVIKEKWRRNSGPE